MCSCICLFMWNKCMYGYMVGIWTVLMLGTPDLVPGGGDWPQGNGTCVVVFVYSCGISVCMVIGWGYPVIGEFFYNEHIWDRPPTDSVTWEKSGIAFCLKIPFGFHCVIIGHNSAAKILWISLKTKKIQAQSEKKKIENVKKNGGWIFFLFLSAKMLLQEIIE
jgi:hypothetical protein